MKQYSDQDYYWAKAEFQDKLEHCMKNTSNSGVKFVGTS